MSDLPYFKFYPGDWLKGVLALTLEERGAYITLLSWSWENGPLPTERQARANILGVTTRKLDALWRRLSDHWEHTSVGWVNERMELERAKLAKAHAKQSAGGSKGANRRWAAYRLTHEEAIGEAIATP